MNRRSAPRLMSSANERPASAWRRKRQCQSFALRKAETPRRQSPIPQTAHGIRARRLPETPPRLHMRNLRRTTRAQSQGAPATPDAGCRLNRRSRPHRHPPTRGRRCERRMRRGSPLAARQSDCRVRHSRGRCPTNRRPIRRRREGRSSRGTSAPTASQGTRAETALRCIPGLRPISSCPAPRQNDPLPTAERKRKNGSLALHQQRGGRRGLLPALEADELPSAALQPDLPRPVVQP